MTISAALAVALYFFIFVILFTLAARYGTEYVGRILGEKINALHQDAETILNTEQIPVTWLEPAPPDPAKHPAWARRQKRRALKKLKKLQSYMQNTPSISDVESREYVLAELSRIREQWISSDLAQIAAPHASQTSR